MPSTKTSDRSNSFLLDVNVLVALAWGNHLHHGAAHRWFERLEGEATWKTCAATQTAFLRISCNSRITDHSVSPARAGRQLAEMTAHPRHAFLIDDVNWSREAESLQKVHGHRQVHDLHLLLLAARNDSVVATFDRGLGDLALHLDQASTVETIPSVRDDQAH
ncbi:MAG: hypothetical protein DWQ36_17420 [Acidobacteria bacterium]|nr:MAG: hypothetical protein DWQ30_23225 [Acidobacteriota bacterium]REK04436.1 MAG: hypothetical protein DWQ36_17420 [Acidobacteriota bacterium]